MRKLVLLLLFITISVNLLCQEKAMLLDSMHWYMLDSHDDWIFRGWNDRIIYCYDSKGNQIEQIAYNWDPTSNRWLGFYKYISTYDPKGKIIEQIGLPNFSYVDNGRNVFRNVFSYDANNHINEIIRYEWDSLSNEWIMTDLACVWGNCWEDGWGGRITYSNNPNGEVITPADPDFEYSFGNNDTITYFDLDSARNDWEKQLQLVFLFDSNGFVTQGTEYNWDSDSNKWLRDGKYIEYEHDASGNLTKFFYGHCDLLLDTCYRNLQDTWEYDANGLIIEHNEYLTYSWGENNFAGDHISRTEYILDYDGNIIESISYAISDEVGTYKKVYYWSAFIASTGSNSRDHRSIIYPNPTSDFLTIESDYSGHQSLEITSLNGQTIYSTNIEGTTHQIDLSSFQHGVYFITIRSEEFVKTEKIIKLGNL